VTPEELAKGGLEAAAARFDALHEKLYAFALPSEKELINLRAVATSRSSFARAQWIEQADDADPEAARIGEQAIYVDGEERPAGIYDRGRLKAGHRVPGDRHGDGFDDPDPAGSRGRDRRVRQHPDPPDAGDDGGVMARPIETNPEPFRTVEVDPITLDLVENGLVNARTQMDALLFRTAMSPIIREQRDGFPVITDRSGRLVAGQFGSPVSGFIDGLDETVEDGDVFLTSDPYACRGSVSHANDWLVCMPVFRNGRLINWSAMFGHMSDIGGKVPGSMPTDATDQYEEGICIPPVKIVRKGELQEDVLRVILHNCRIPEWNRSDFRALIASASVGRARCLEMAERFGDDLYTASCSRGTGARSRR
jgi:hypothetical protein